MDQQVDAVNRVLADIKNFLPDLVGACTNIADVIQEPLAAQEWEQFGYVIDGIDDLYRTLTHVNNSLNEYDFRFALQPCIARAITDINDTFQDMNRSMDQEDYIGASDCMTYELIPVLKQLETDLGQDKQTLEQRFNRNRNYFQIHKPMLYDRIRSEARNREHYQIVTSKNGKPNLYIKIEGQDPLYLYSRYNPDREVERWVDKRSIKPEETTSIFFYGFGFGYHIERYASLYPQHRLYIYEPDVQILLAAMEVVDFQAVFERYPFVDFIVGADGKNREKMFYHFARYAKGEPELYTLPVYDHIRKEDKEQFYQEAALAVGNYNSSIIRSEKSGVEWVRNSLYNLQATLITPSIAGLKNKCNGMTAVIIGAGPSLEADISHLIKLKEHAFLIAAGSAIQSLLHYGIRPHLIVSIDGGESNYRVFKNTNIEGIPLLYAPMIHYQIIDDNRNHLLHAFLDNDVTMDHLMELRNGEPRFQSTLSVTGTAIQAAVYMGCNEIVFTGQDLSFPANTLYAPGARHVSEAAMNAIVESADMFVENVQGGTNRYHAGMEQTLANIEGLIEQYPDVAFTNSSSKGAKIKHTAYRPMEEVLESLQHQQVAEDFLLHEIERLQGYTPSRISAIVERTMKLPGEMDRYENQLMTLSNRIGGMPKLSRTEPNKCIKSFQAIHADWKMLLNSDPYRGLYMKVCRNELLTFERDFAEYAGESDLNKKAELAVRVMLPLIQTMLKKTPELKGIVREAISRLEAQ
ncbi:motility associated factor glycosyltransferase family protein [Paenibacillus spongiae]|uniref:DUF115 domain-containing protein n=1 Tax=Paenibacillus spongiae TaxID=2909671 RepID=A0ABY5S7I7_9BACL|nr:6-hydroxymethylpterin diphosphokinase MptE-like protein [Paenibacillus spongiae]UVI29886.1 DUF115 domain-containing protein [Paenibacillus spongiae]